MREEIISQIFKDKDLHNLSLRYDANGDLWSELMVYLCEMPTENLLHIHTQGFMRYHVVSCITRSSLMYKNYTKFANKVTLTDQPINTTDVVAEYHELINLSGVDVSIDEVLYLIDKVVEQENIYDKELFRMITVGVDIGNGEIKKFKSLAEVSRATGISYTTLHNSYKRTIKRINEKVTNIISKRWRT